MAAAAPHQFRFWSYLRSSLLVLASSAVGDIGYEFLWNFTTFPSFSIPFFVFLTPSTVWGWNFLFFYYFLVFVSHLFYFERCQAIIYKSEKKASPEPSPSFFDYWDKKRTGIMMINSFFIMSPIMYSIQFWLEKKFPGMQPSCPPPPHSVPLCLSHSPPAYFSPSLFPFLFSFWHGITSKKRKWGRGSADCFPIKPFFSF